MVSLVLGAIGSAIAGSIWGTATWLGVSAAGWGWTIGSVVGNILFPSGGTNIEGPRLSNLKAMTSNYGDPIPILVGLNVRIGGSVLWEKPLRELKTKKKSGGKGGGGSTVTTYTYYGTWAVMLGLGDIDRNNTGYVDARFIQRIWFDNELVYDVSPDAEFGPLGTNGSADFEDKFTFYPGTFTQTVDPLYEAYVGTENACAYRGRCHIVFDDILLTKYGNRIPNVSVEIIHKLDVTISLSVISRFGFNWCDYVLDDPAILGNYMTNITPLMYPIDRETMRFYYLKAKAFVSPNWVYTFATVGLQWDGVHYYTEPSVVEEDTNIVVDTYVDGGVPGFIANSNGMMLDYDDTNWRWNSIYGGKGGVIEVPDIGGGYTQMQWSVSGGLVSPPRYETKMQYRGSAVFVLWASPEPAPNARSFLCKYNVSNASATPGATLQHQAEILRDGTDSIATQHRNMSIFIDWDGDFIYLLDPADSYYNAYVGDNIIDHATLTKYSTTDLSVVATWENISINAMGIQFGVNWCRLGAVGYPTAFTVLNGNHLIIPVDTGVSSPGVPYIVSMALNDNGTVTFDTVSYAGIKTCRPFGYYKWWVLSDAYTMWSQDFIMKLGYLDEDGKKLVQLDEVIKLLIRLVDSYTLYSLAANVVTSKLVDGFVVTHTMQARGAIESLARAYDLYILESDWNLKIGELGAFTEIDIPEEDIGVFTDMNNVSVLEEDSMAEYELPRRIVLKYLSKAKDYNENIVTSSRSNDAVITNTDMSVEIPMVLDDDWAQQLADILLNRVWTERDNKTFTLYPEYLELDAADVVRFTINDLQHTVRIKDWEYSDGGMIRVSGPLESASNHVSTSTGETGLPPSQVVHTIESTYVVILDIPMLSEYLDGPYYAARGDTESWGGMVLYRSVDGGSTFSEFDATDIPATIGQTTDALGSGRTDTWDLTNSVNVDLAYTGYTDDTIESYSEDTVLGGAVGAAIGVEGRWEIIQWVDVVQETDGTFTLSKLLRGRFGTEHNIGNHAIGDYFIVLDSNTLRDMDLPNTDINLQRIYRGVTVNAEIAGASNINFTWLGVNLKPLSPVNLGGTRDGSNNLTIGWIRRDRVFPTYPYTSAPMSESELKFIVKIYDDTKTTLYRTEYVTEEQYVYSAANQTSDGATPGDRYIAEVAQISGKVGPGYYTEGYV